jgi:hypothetical protein
MTFYCVEKYEFQYSKVASGSRNSFWPSDISDMLEGDESAEKFSDSDDKKLSDTNQNNDIDIYLLRLNDG